MKRQTAEQMLIAKGLTTNDLRAMLQHRRQLPKVLRPRKTRRYKFAIISDTHMCDKGHALAELHNFYKLCEAEGITEVVHAGDIVAGQNVYRGQVNDLLVYGLDAQTAYVVKNYPVLKNGKTYFIIGNHCESFITTAGADIGEQIADKRSDLVYLGIHDAEVVLNGVTVGLHHGAKGVPYSISYHLQKYIEKLGAGQKPQIYVLGHYHASLYMFYRGIHAFLPGCWQRANNFSVRLGLPECIGGWIIDLVVEDDEKNSIRSINQKFVAYY